MMEWLNLNMIKNKNKQKTWKLQISDIIQYVLFSRPLLYSKWNVGDLNIPEKSEFGHILIQDYFIYGSCIIFKNNLIYLYSSQYWGSGGWLICPKSQSWDKAELNENTISGSTQVPSHKTSMLPLADLPDGSPGGFWMLPELLAEMTMRPPRGC